MENVAKTEEAPMYCRTYSNMAPLDCEWPNKDLGVMVSGVMAHAQHPETGAVSVGVEVPVLSTKSFGSFTSPDKWRERAAVDTNWVIGLIREIKEELTRHETRLVAELESLMREPEGAKVEQ